MRSSSVQGEFFWSLQQLTCLPGYFTDFRVGTAGSGKTMQSLPLTYFTLHETGLRNGLQRLAGLVVTDDGPRASNGCRQAKLLGDGALSRRDDRTAETHCSYSNHGRKNVAVFQVPSSGTADFPMRTW